MEIIKCLFAIFFVIFYLKVGMFIGKEFGTFENFIIAILNKIKRRIDEDELE